MTATDRQWGPRCPDSHDHRDLSSQTHGFAPGLSRYVRAEPRISGLRPPAARQLSTGDPGTLPRSPSAADPGELARERPAADPGELARWPPIADPGEAGPDATAAD